MSEEQQVADSDQESGDTGGTFDMNGALDSISSDLFGSSEHDETPVDNGEPAEDDAPSADETKPVEAAKPTEPTVRQAPQSWKKEMHEKYADLPADVQDYIIEREEQMRAGLEKDRGDANLGRVMRDVMTPFREHIRSQGVDEPRAVQYLLTAHYKLSTAPIAERTAMLHSLAKDYGIELTAAPAGEQPAQLDPALKALKDELDGIKTHLNAGQQAAMRDAKERVSKDVDAFASDPSHPYFDEVSTEIVAFLQAGHELKDAYEKAVWANPVTRQKEIARLQQETERTAREKAEAEAEAARKAASNTVRGRNTQRTPTETKGSMKDLDASMRETLREIKNRTAH